MSAFSDPLLYRIFRGIVGKKEEITASGTWTVPSKIYEVTAVVVGGGAGGVSGTGEGGGGGEIFIAKNFPVTPAESISITIGAGGAALSDGGYSLFGRLCANGGAAATPALGGQGYSRSAGGGATGHSGILSDGEQLSNKFISISGGGGANGGAGNPGGDSPFASGGTNDGNYNGGGGSWGAGGNGNSAGTGQAGQGYGGGGGAGVTGGAGADGIVILYYTKFKR
jgi:hypothetical protein